jgi:hypothetical protein
MKKVALLVAAITVAATMLVPSAAIAGGDKVQAHRPGETGYFGEGQHAEGEPAVSHRQFQAAR